MRGVNAWGFVREGAADALTFATASKISLPRMSLEGLTAVAAMAAREERAVRREGGVDGKVSRFLLVRGGRRGRGGSFAYLQCCNEEMGRNLCVERDSTAGGRLLTGQ